MEMKFFTELFNKKKKHRGRNTNVRSELGVDEIKKCHLKEHFKMVWRCAAENFT